MCDKPVDDNSRVFRIGREVRKQGRDVESLPPVELTLDLKVSLFADRIEVVIPATGECWKQALECQPALKHPLSEAILSSEFARSGETELCAGRVSGRVDGNLFIPAGELKKVRRAFWRWASDNVSVSALRDSVASSLRRAVTEPIALQPALPARRVVMLAEGGRNRVSRSTTSRPLGVAGRGDEARAPEFCSEVRLEGVRQQISRAGAQHVTSIRAASLYMFGLKEVGDIPLIASFSIPACNHLAVQELLSLGASRVMMWPELTDQDVQELVASCGSVLDMYVYGRLPLLSTRMELPVEGPLRDGRGGEFEVRKEGELFWLYPAKALRVEAPEGVGEVIDLTHAAEGEQGVSFNQQRDWV